MTSTPTKTLSPIAKDASQLEQLAQRLDQINVQTAAVLERIDSICERLDPAEKKNPPNLNQTTPPGLLGVLHWNATCIQETVNEIHSTLNILQKLI